MRRVILLLGAGSAMASLLSAETTQTKATPPRKHTASKASTRTSKSAASKSASHSTAKSTTAKGTSTKSTASKGKSKTKGNAVSRTARSYQQAPTTERYQEIQQALAKKGYFQGEASGKWGADSSDALKRFQAEQNLAPDGKINSLSLIALGLGPKRLTAQSKSATPPPPAPASQ